jgi:gamma-glutamyltranspeptidase / glutathione hydrolase / leukotriene-C4 hydrolase
MTLEDLQGYTPIVRTALQGTYHGKKVYTTYAPTSGPVVLHMLNLLERYDLASKATKTQAELNIHRVVESLKCAYDTEYDTSGLPNLHTVRCIQVGFAARYGT